MKDYLSQPFSKEPPPLDPMAIQILKQWDAMSRYEDVGTTSELRRLIRTSKKYKEVSLDTETTGIDTITARALGYSFSFEEHVAYWVPIKLDPQLKILNELVQNKTVIFFNAGYDLAIVEKYGVTIPDDKIVDVMIACFFRDVDGYKFNAGLKAQSQMLLDMQTIGLKDIIMANTGAKRIKDNEVDFNLLEPWQQRVYGCQDADITMMLWRHPEIQKAVAAMPEIWELEHKIIRPVMEMYQNGVGIDLERTAELDKILVDEIEICNTKAGKMAETAVKKVKKSGVVLPTIRVTSTTKGVKTDKDVCPLVELDRLSKKKGLNLGSFRQKQLLLFNILQLPETRKTETGCSTDQDALSEIEGEHAIVPLIMRYNKLKSRRTAYTKKLPDMVNPATGRIHPSLWATGAKSGRFSCSNPNMQGISKDHAVDDPAQIREVFVPAKGNMLTAADYSQIELRIAASLSQEPILCDAYNAGNIDVHKKTASEMYERPMVKVTGDQRDTAKTANFSILTGISAYSLSAKNRKTITSQEMAQQIIDSWFAALPVLTTWIGETKRLARTTGLQKTYFGRIRPLPEIKHPRPESIDARISDMRLRPWAANKEYDDLVEMAKRSIQASCERYALSHLIQGTAADIMKIAIIKVRRALIESKLPVKMLLTVHDELLFEHPPKVKKKLDALLQETMTFEKLGPGWVPLTIDIGQGQTWAEAH